MAKKERGKAPANQSYQHWPENAHHDFLTVVSVGPFGRRLKPIPAKKLHMNRPL